MKALNYDHLRWDFFRPLDWRRAEARKLAARPGRPCPVDDPAVAALAAVARADRGDRRRRPEPPEWVHIREARRLHDAGGLRRAEAEARVLAGQTDAEIAAACGLHPDVVRWYEATFFHVRDRLPARDWVTCRVIGRHFPADDPAPVWKQFAYAGGPVALNAVMAVLTGGPLPAVMTATFSDDPTYEEATVRFLVSLHVAALRATTAAEWLGLIEAYAAAQREDRRRGGRPLLNADVRPARETMRLVLTAAGRGPGRRTGRGSTPAPGSAERPKAPARRARKNGELRGTGPVTARAPSDSLRPGRPRPRPEAAGPGSDARVPPGRPGAG